MISEKTAKLILTVGEDYRNPRGGISGLINTYSSFFTCFKFVPTYKPKFNKYFNFFYYPLSLFLLVKKLLFDKEIKIIHIHGCHGGSFFRKLIVLMIGKKLFLKKIIYHSHGSDFHIFYNESNSLIKKLIQYFMSNVDLVICLSRQWKTFFEDKFIMKETIILENIVNKPVIQIKDIETNYIKVLFLGYIGERKGIFDLLDVIRENKAYFKGKAIFIIGGNGDAKRLERFIDDNGMNSLVLYRGWISGKIKEELLSSSDIFVLPSYNEGLPISILEAMSYKLPIISTDVGGISEIIHNMVNGIIINPGDKVALLKSLKTFIQTPTLISEMGNKSAPMVLPHYAEYVIPKLESIYLKMLAEN